MHNLKRRLLGELQIRLANQFSPGVVDFEVGDARHFEPGDEVEHSMSGGGLLVQGVERESRRVGWRTCGIRPRLLRVRLV
jgi:hypothetical protein